MFIWNVFQVALPGVNCRSFVAVLEYLYTDNCTSLGKIPAEDVLVLADFFCLTHLVQICEVQIYGELLNMTKKDLLDVLAFAKVSGYTKLSCKPFFFLNDVSF